MSSAAVPHRFTPDTYVLHAATQQQWGESLARHVGRSKPRLALDAGCGTGVSTEILLERLPSTHVVAVDIDYAMAVRARERLHRAGHARRVNVVVANLERGPITAVGAVDALFSVATFHWITDHAALWRNVAHMVAPGGLVFAEYGGAGNLASVATALGSPLRGRHFASVEETRAVMADAGLDAIHVGLRPAPQSLASRELVRATLAALVMHEYSSAEIDRVVDALPDQTLDWVRLEVVARRAATGHRPE